MLIIWRVLLQTNWVFKLKIFWVSQNIFSPKKAPWNSLIPKTCYKLEFHGRARTKSKIISTRRAKSLLCSFTKFLTSEINGLSKGSGRCLKLLNKEGWPLVLDFRNQIHVKPQSSESVRGNLIASQNTYKFTKQVKMLNLLTLIVCRQINHHHLRYY